MDTLRTDPDAITSPTANKSVEQRGDEFKTSFTNFGLESGFAYYSTRNSDGSRSFEFPTQHPLGTLNWWQGGILHTKPAIGSQTIPANVKLIFNIARSYVVIAR